MNVSDAVRPWQIDVHDRQDIVAVEPEEVVRAVEQVLRQEACPRAEISVALVDDAEIQRLNREFLDHDYPTDVISFTYRPAPDLEGELIVGAERAYRVAGEMEHGWKSELLWYIVHGTLHLLGYEDGTEADRRAMRGREQEAMKALELEWPLERGSDR